MASFKEIGLLGYVHMIVLFYSHQSSVCMLFNSIRRLNVKNLIFGFFDKQTTESETNGAKFRILFLSTGPDRRRSTNQDNELWS